MPMPQLTIVYAVLLILLGVIGYGVAAAGLTSSAASPTALIPVFFGIVFLAIGLAAKKYFPFRKHLMHAAAVLALLAIFGTLPRAVRVLTAAGFDLSKVNALAVVAQLIMGVLSLLFVVLCILSFISARKSRLAKLA